MKRQLVGLYGMVLLVAFVGSGCAVGNKYNYSNVMADIATPGNSSVSVATHDQREYVVSGAKAPQFIGLQRGGFGNPFNVSTQSNRPLADDITDNITASLSQKGFKAMPVAVSFSDKPEAVLEKAKAANADRIVLLTLNEWKSDTYANVALQFNVTMSVYDKDGKKLAGKTIEGRDNLGGSSWNPPAHARKALPAALKEKLEQLLNSPEIAKNLNK